MVNGRPNEGLSGAFKKVATEFNEIPLNKHSPEEITKSFIPDILFLQIHNATVDGVDSRQLFEGLIKDLESKGTKVINWNGDITFTDDHAFWVCSVYYRTVISLGSSGH